MASGDAELVMAAPHASTRGTDDPTVHSDTTNAEQELESTRARLTKCLFYASLVTLVVSVAAIIIGFMAIAQSDSHIPYVLGGGLIAGSMALILTICPFCMVCEQKKTGNKLTGRFRCCVILMTIWYAFAFCGVLVGFALSGIWGLVECVNAEQKTGYISINPCVENTSSKYALALATLVLSGTLVVLTTVICCFSCQRAFGYKSKYERRWEHYRGIARLELQQEMAAERNIEQRTDHRPNVNDRLYQHPGDSDSPSFESENKNRNHSPYRDRDYHSPGEPSAPPLDGYNVNGDRSPYRDRNHHHPSAPPLDNRDRRPNDNYMDRQSRDRGRNGPRPDERNRSSGPHSQGAPRRTCAESRAGRKKDDNEAPPPSYDDVLRKELKGDDV